MTDAKGQLITRPAGWGRVGGTAGDSHTKRSWWYLLAVTSTGADTVRSDLAARLLNRLTAGLVALWWLRGARTTRATNGPLSGVS